MIQRMGITYLMYGASRRRHTEFMFAETDGMTKVTESMRPTNKLAEYVVTLVTER